MSIEKYGFDSAHDEASEIKKRVDYGIADDYQEANDQVDSENSAALRQELMALQDISEEITPEKVTLEEVKGFMGDLPIENPDTITSKTEDSIHVVREHRED